MSRMQQGTYPRFCVLGMTIIPGTLCGTVTGFALSTLAIISSPGKIRNEGTRKNCISAEMSENGRESNTLYENEKRNKIGDLSYFSDVLSYDTRQEADIISAWILKNIRRRERHDYIKWNMADELQGGRLLAGRTGAGNGLHRSASQWTDERPVCRRKRG